MHIFNLFTIFTSRYCNQLIKIMDKTAVIYARTSSTGAVINKQNTTRQVADLTSYAAHNNLSIVEVYEEHISGT